ncbi:twin-arginine protein translocation system subunit TatC [Oleiphilus sp. HI0071]|uniref:twin-arginine translocase subunit TatC n=1 Tax=unclassified Oleiphilus TaxID=2631174 RepID=UPI0007C207AB|nr:MULTISPECIES: twin-arginine translocase subunit TatC [unclassified Oleiphilus]KZY63731.1 twin-arginine protein translocation system subunit TatC [Oleiphilus sp. HI0065]KZY86493.1 twin-arginine protein translocation system subunit TatC [Oleiphilus sp. HI0071]KZZ06049.1 twin-arginine protein translocation system subunit TatC [Oleiphilus sp. HI0073]KZZ43313.1 twin-arginine protein translocation system subunit TatC [Oleiphilus sp. HI0118]KZZ51392.1 twin-arginine protein translocation system sub
MSEQDSVNPDDKDQAQPLIAHLIELRDRMLRAVIAVMVIFLSLYYFANDLYFLLSEPLRALLPEGATMIATGVASPFLTPFKLTFVASIFIAMPVILYQVWAFISPALFDKERKLAIPLLVSSIILFYFGMAFAYFVVFPLVFGFFTSAGPEDVAIMTDISQYLDFVLKMFFAFGFAFEIPIAIIILVAVGATSTSSLSEKRPYLVIGCFVVGMLLTPPDVISQTLLAVPMWLLFEVGLVFAKMIEKPNDETEADTPAT